MLGRTTYHPRFVTARIQVQLTWFSSGVGIVGFGSDSGIHMVEFRFRFRFRCRCSFVTAKIQVLAVRCEMQFRFRLKVV